MADKTTPVKQWSYDARKVLILGKDGVNMASVTNPLSVDAVVSVDTMNINAEMSEATGHDYYVTTTNLGDGTLTIGFDSVSGLALEDVIKVENKTQGWVYITKGATVGATSILLVAANQETGYPACGATDEFEVVYRDTSRLTNKTQMSQISDGTNEVDVIATINSLKSDTSSIAGTATDVNNGSVSAGTQRVTIADDSTGQTKITDGTDALDVATDGSAAKTKGVQVLGTDGTNAQTLKTRTDGSLLTVADIVLATGNNLIGSSDGSDPDFDLAYASATTLTVGNYKTGPVAGSALKATDIVFIRVQDASGDHVETLDAKDLTLAISGATLTVTGFAASFASDDTFIIGTNVRAKDAIDSGSDLIKAEVTNSLVDEYDDVVTWVSTAQELDATPTDAGSEIDMRGRNLLGVWGTVDIGTSTNFQLRVLNKHTSAGSEEYRQVSLTVGSPADTQTSMNYNDYLVTPDADGLFFLPIEVGNLVPFVQLQVFDAADGDGQLDKLYITKAWSPSV